MDMRIPKYPIFFRSDIKKKYTVNIYMIQIWILQARRVSSHVYVRRVSSHVYVKSNKKSVETEAKSISLTPIDMTAHSPGPNTLRHDCSLS
jgi:hypothetical protein